MNISITKEVSEFVCAKINIVFIHEDKYIAESIKKEVKNLDDTIKNKGQYKEIFLTALEFKGAVQNFLFCGIGNLQKLNISKIRRLGAMISEKLNSLKFEEASILFDDRINEIANFSTELIEGILLKNYMFNKYFSEESKKKLYLNSLKLYGISKNVENDIKLKEKIADSVHFARDLVSEPGNNLNTEKFVEICKELEKMGVKVTILNKAKLKELKMNALLGVAQGSLQEPYVAIMEWKNSDSKKVVFAGKGVTFDSGGINIKPSGPSISLMKYDMGGAAVVVGLIKLLASRKARVNVSGIIGLVENMPSGSAQRPGDVVKSMSGKTIEIDNTDAEGRLVLADIMHYSQEYLQPDLLIDLATLTGAAVVALGHEKAALLSNDQNLVNDLLKSGKNIDEELWQLPLGAEYDKLIESDIADVRNVGKGGAGTITAAQFLQRFISNNLPWAHIDIAGVNWSDKGTYYAPRGATGFGIRLLNEFLSKYNEQ